ncbi:amidase [Diaphorobacter aerolatus]|uniref:Amidase n=1 Tax=Diaphorobacter aerolatus TaxID=1288495 RepID=A0A7H0GJ08_9BURK|nr:amidase [Diaphorobacter aerolatus]QNP48274.1 amidase [Diaphorobacter aerolatus]
MQSNSVQRTGQILAAIHDAGDEGRRIFTRVYGDAALSTARAADERAKNGISLSALDGRVVSVKDLYDIAGEPTTAGSAVLRSAPPAKEDAVIVQRLRAAGAVIVGKTNMTEFAFSGIGINPHYGTPGNAHDATRIPGGSSSGAGVAVARGMSEISIGSDTGGSVRIPSAFNGITGFKPTQSRVPRDGAFPLSFSLDSVGPLARNVLDCAQADAIMSGRRWNALAPREVRGLRIGIPRGLLFTQTEQAVQSAFERVIDELSRSGCRISDMQLDEWCGAPFKLQEKGTLIAAEAAYIHADTLARQPDAIDPFVLARIKRGETMPAPHYVGLQRAREQLRQSLDARIADLDLLMLPTVALIAPHIDSVANPDAFNTANMLVLRNTSVFNFYDLPAMSLPINVGAAAMPVGLMVVARRNCDLDLLAMARRSRHRCRR